MRMFLLADQVEYRLFQSYYAPGPVVLRAIGTTRETPVERDFGETGRDVSVAGFLESGGADSEEGAVAVGRWGPCSRIGPADILCRFSWNDQNNNRRDR